MRKIILAGMVCIGFASCTYNKTEEHKTVQQPVETKRPADTPRRDGTTIKMNNDGISVESKDGQNKSDVKITTDTTQVEVSRPK